MTPEARIKQRINHYLDVITRVNLRTGAGAARIGERYLTIGAAGTSDQTCCLCGRFVAVEVKAPGEQLRPNQRAYRENVLAEGGIHIVADSVDALRAALGHHFGAAQLAVWDAALVAEKERQRQLRLRPENRKAQL
jgi:hypothetical protein